MSPTATCRGCGNELRIPEDPARAQTELPCDKRRRILPDRTDRILAARRAAKTRRVNRENRQYYQEWMKPAYDRIDGLLNSMLRRFPTVVQYTGERRLKHGVTSGVLIAVKRPVFLVQPVGYAHPQWFHGRYWKPSK